jgi:hypothetical protein
VQNNPGLYSVIDAWPQLPDAMRAAIVAMVRAAAPQQQDDQSRGERER